MLLVADVGNTETTVGLFNGENILAQWRLTTSVPRTPDEMAILLSGLLAGKGVTPKDLHGCAIGSVVPSMTALLHEAMTTLSSAKVVVIDGGTPLPIRLDVDEPLGVGADR